MMKRSKISDSFGCTKERRSSLSIAHPPHAARTTLSALRAALSKWAGLRVKL